MLREDTIAAIATAAGDGAVGVVRLSGPSTRAIVEKCFSAATKALAQPRTLHLGHFVTPQEHQSLDRGLLVYFQGPHSYSGEDMAEWHAHGGQALLRQLLQALFTAGARPAEPGEFTLRAFLNGKMDLLQAEAVGDAIRAGSARASVLAQRQLEGALSQWVGGHREALLSVLTELQASIDFPDEDLRLESDQRLLQKLDTVQEALSQSVATFARGRLVREGAHVVLAGKTNAGKSSLFNAFLAREQALVSATPGTTRDVLSFPLQVHGLGLTLSDTAGLQDTAVELDRRGVDRARKAVTEADAVLWVLDRSRPWDSDDDATWQLLAPALGSKPVLLVLNKNDLAAHLQLPQSVQGQSLPHFEISAQHGAGLDPLLDGLYHALLQENGESQQESLLANTRHLEALTRCRDSVQAAQASLRDKEPPELVAVHVQGALHQLAALTGEVTTEDVLDRIFSEFCIGK